MRQGTVSIIIGCHSPFHSILVWLSWRKLYKKAPCFWETVCIFLHDIGHFGKDYLKHFEEKKSHWEVGARIAYKLFNTRGYDLCAGHCDYSDEPRSKLYYADKHSWYIAPFWWLYLNNIFEPSLKKGMSNMQACRDFKAQVKQSIESRTYRSTHQMYLERVKND